VHRTDFTVKNIGGFIYIYLKAV